MTVFGKYADFYDTMYGEKDYEVECGFIEALFHRYANRHVKSILDLGCGTGGHLIPLARKGYGPLAGVDRSETMLKTAQEKASESSATINFHLDDIRNVRLGQKFDAVISMFAVMCYQTANADLENAIQTARAHLEPGGLFVFDGWFGPGVLVDPPSQRLKKIPCDNGDELLRMAVPGPVNASRQTVEINYTLLRIKGDRIIQTVEEKHTMRFFFPQEIAYFLEKNGFEPLHFCPFLEMDRPLQVRDWQITIVGRAV